MQFANLKLELSVALLEQLLGVFVKLFLVLKQGRVLRHLELFPQVVGDLLQEQKCGVAIEIRLHFRRVFRAEEEPRYQQLQVKQVRLERVEVVQFYGQAAEVRLVLQAVYDAVLREGEHRSTPDLFKCFIAQESVDRLVSCLDVLSVADDIEQRLCRFLIEERTLGSRTVLQRGVPDDFTDRDA